MHNSLLNLERLKMPEAAIIHYSKNPSEMAESTKRFCRGSEFVLLLNSNVQASRLLPAYVNALLRHRKKEGKANTVQMEMLLLVCGTDQIQKAITKCGAKEKEALAFATSKQLLLKFIKQSNAKITKKLTLAFDFDTAFEVVASAST